MAVWRGLAAALAALPLLALLWAFEWRVPAVVVHSAAALRMRGAPAPDGPESLELRAAHAVLRENPGPLPAGPDEYRAMMDGYVGVFATRTPWGGNQALPAAGGASVRGEVRMGRAGRALRVAWPGGDRAGHAVLVLHGGSYVAGFPEQQLPYLERLSRRTGAPVYGLDYRLAPEHPVADTVRDVLAALEWLEAERGVPPERVALAGDSAGGGLAALALQALVAQGRPRPAAAVLVSPWVDLSGRLSAASMAENAPRDVFLSSPEAMAWVPLAAGTGAPALDHPSVSPAYGPMAGLPPLLVTVSRTEAIRDEAVAFVRRAAAAGVDAELLMPAADLPHIWPVLGFPESVEDTAVLARWVTQKWDARREAGAPES